MDAGLNETMMVCDDADFNSAIAIIDVLIQHAAWVYRALPIKDKMSVHIKTNPKQLFFDALPKEFSRQGFLTIARNLNLNEDTVERYITQFVYSNLIKRLARDKYEK